MKNIDTTAILESLKTSDTFTIQKADKKTLGYVRCFFNRKGFFVTKIGDDAVITRVQKDDKLRTELYKQLTHGEKFIIECAANQTQYLRTLVSQYNRTAEVKRRVQVVEPGKFLIYPNPLYGMVSVTPEPDNPEHSNPFLT